MATIDYKEKYEAALAVAQETYNTQPMYREWLESMFPELKESEDERIRKSLIDMLKNDEKCYLEEIAWLEKQGEHNNFIDKIQVGDKVTRNEDGMLVNLSQLDRVAKKDEKQGEKKSIDDLTPQEAMDIAVAKCFEEGEQKPADKVEPKFNVGDWVVWDNKISCHIDNIYQGKESLMYTITDVHNMTRSCSVKGFDNNAHLWTIQDAKDGEVLVAHECYVIFKEIDGLNIKCYCTYHYLGSNPSFYVDTLQNKTAFYPATKKQREFLFKKMHDAGYEWDAEKLELRKVEQKIEEKPLISLTDFQKAFELKAKQYDINLPNRGYDIHAMCKELYSLLTKQKPAEWSEEDEERLRDIINELVVIKEDANVRCSERALSDIIADINWLKSLRPQNTWKPSDLPHWKKSTLPNDNTTGFNSDYFCYKGYNINYKELFEKLPKDD